MLGMLTCYHMDYIQWLDLLRLYPEHAMFQDVDLPLQFIHGLGIQAQHLLTMELANLSVLKTHDKWEFQLQGSNIAIPLSLHLSGSAIQQTETSP